MVFFVFLVLLNRKHKKKTLIDEPIQQQPLINETGDTVVTGIPIQLIEKKIHPDSIAKPLTRKLIPPTVVKTNRNITSFSLKNQLKKSILYSNNESVAQPIAKKITGTNMPTSHPEPKTVEQFQFRDASRYNLQFLDVDQGLSSSYISGVLEDKKGNIWFATNGSGVGKYNGISIVNYGINEGLADNIVFKITQDNDHNLWFSTYSRGIIKFDGNNFTRYGHDEGFPSYVKHQLNSNDGSLWIASDEGLFKYQNETLEHFTKDHGLVHQDIEVLFKDSEENLWIGTTKGLSYFNGEMFSSVTIPFEGKLVDHITAITEDHKGRIWLGTSNNGIIVIENDSIKRIKALDGLGDNTIYALYPDTKNNMWIGTASNGLIKYDGNTLTRFGESEGLTNKPILDIIEDQDGIFWIATNGDGLQKLNPYSFEHYTEENGLTNNIVRSMHLDKNKQLWFGTSAGLHQYNGKEFYQYQEALGVNDIIRSVYTDSKNNVWVGTSENGVLKIQNNTIYQYTDESGLSGNDVLSILEDQSGNIWFCTNGHGITKLKDGKFSHITENEKFSSNYVWGILEDSKGNIWFGTNGSGIAKYNGKTYTYYTSREGLSSDIILTLIEDKNNNIWIGTSYGGLNKFDGNEFSSLSINDGLCNDIVWSVLETKNGLWLGTERGLSFYDFKTELFTNYYKADGLKGLDFFKGSVVLDEEENIWWGSGKTLTRINQKKFLVDTSAPKIQLEHIYLAQEYVDYRKLKDPEYIQTLAFGKKLDQRIEGVKQFYNFPTNLELPYNINHLTFHFSGIDWANPRAIEYQYIIDGLDENWSIPNKEGIADYRNIPHGSYTFKVRARGASLDWSDPIQYSFTITPPWWHTIWARLLYAGIAVLLIYAFLKWRTSILRKKQKEELLRQRKIQEEKLEEQRKITMSYSRFVPSEFLKSLSKKDILDVALGDHVESNLTVMFSDIRSYTTLSEQMTVKQNFKFLNAFLGRMGPIIKSNEGFVNQFLGDGIMALFQNNPENSLKAALAMQKELKNYNIQRSSENRAPIHIGIGLHYGPLMMGIIGDHKRMDAGVVSDTVNTAARVEGLTKYYGASILLSDSTVNHIKDINQYQYRYLGKVVVKGKNKPLGLYEFFGGDEENTKLLKEQTKTTFANGLAAYYNKNFEEAITLFAAILQKNPNDLAALLYETQSKEYQKTGVPDDWAGAQTMNKK